jgi:hypothetical protein
MHKSPSVVIRVTLQYFNVCYVSYHMSHPEIGQKFYMKECVARGSIHMSILMRTHQREGSGPLDTIKMASLQRCPIPEHLLT